MKKILCEKTYLGRVVILNNLHFLDRPTRRVCKTCRTLKLHIIYDCRTNEYFKIIIFDDNDDDNSDNNEDDNNGDGDNENMYSYFGDDDCRRN